MNFFDKLKQKMGNNNNEDLDKNEEQNLNQETEQGAETVNEGANNVNIDDMDELELAHHEKEKAHQELGESKEKYIRLFAEFDNYKKRTARENVELIKSAGKKVIKEILPVLDDFERAFKTNIDENEADHNEGFTLIYNKMKRVLEGMGVKQMESMGEVFDINLHEAVAEIPASSEDMKGKIMDVVEQGYYLNDVIIRYAKVVVGK